MGTSNNAEIQWQFKYVGGDKIYFFRISCRTDIFAIDAGRFVIHESPQ